MNEQTIGRLAAEMLVEKCNWRCRRLAREQRIVEVNSNGGEWGILENEIERLQSSKNPVEALAAQRLSSLVAKTLEPLIEDTKLLAMTLTNGKVRFEQYSEGLITASEYMNGLIDEVSKRN